MNPMDLFWILWMFILPILGLALAVLAPIFWFIIVPKIARKLTWDRFRKISYHLIAGTSGYAQLLRTKEMIPEGVVRLENDEWRFLPKPRWKKQLESNPSAEKLALKKYVWKDMGKPIWFGYAGKIASVNPSTLAALQQTDDAVKLDAQVKRVKNYIKDLPEHFRKDLTKMFNGLLQYVEAKKVTLIDPAVIKEVLPRMYTPSQLKALATNRELYGMEKRGKEYGKLILGMGFILSMVIIAILLITVAK